MCMSSRILSFGVPKGSAPDSCLMWKRKVCCHICWPKMKCSLLSVVLRVSAEKNILLAYLLQSQDQWNPETETDFHECPKSWEWKKPEKNETTAFHVSIAHFLSFFAICLFMSFVLFLTGLFVLLILQLFMDSRC